MSVDTYFLLGGVLIASGGVLLVISQWLLARWFRKFQDG